MPTTMCLCNSTDMLVCGIKFISRCATFLIYLIFIFIYSKSYHLEIVFTVCGNFIAKMKSYLIANAVNTLECAAFYDPSLHSHVHVKGSTEARRRGTFKDISTYIVFDIFS